MSSPLLTVIVIVVVVVVSMDKSLFLVVRSAEVRMAKVPALTPPSPFDNPNATSKHLTLALLTPRTGKLGFEQNAAASTMALQQGQRDGYLSDTDITSVTRNDMFVVVVCSVGFGKG